MRLDHESLQQIAQLAIVLWPSGRETRDRAEKILLDVGQHLVEIVVDDTILFTNIDQKSIYISRRVRTWASRTCELRVSHHRREIDSSKVSTSARHPASFTFYQ